MGKIEEITKRFYNTEEERQEKLKKDKVFIEFFTKKLYSFIMSLYNDGIRLHVFDFKDTTIHVGLFPCCDHINIEKINQEKRLEAERHLVDLGFSTIIWEDL